MLNKLLVLWYILTGEEVNLNIDASKAGGCCDLSPEAINLVPWPFLELGGSGEKRLDFQGMEGEGEVHDLVMTVSRSSLRLSRV